jgi:hypothetical protein
LPYGGHHPNGITHRPDSIATSSKRFHWNIGIFSNSEEHPDDLPLRLDGCNLELFEASRH